jgi:hypothetical protein
VNVSQRGRNTHVLLNADRGSSQGSKIKPAMEAHAQTFKEDNSGTSESERARALTLCQTQRKGQFATANEIEREGTHILWSAETRQDIEKSQQGRDNAHPVERGQREKSRRKKKASE